MAVGLIIVKWPQLLQAHTLPAVEGAVLCMLTAMSLLALLGLRYPIGMLPILLFEVMWKVLWLAIIGIPNLLAGDMDSAMESMLFSVAFVVAIIAATPWDYVRKSYVNVPGDRWAGLARSDGHVVSVDQPARAGMY